MIDQEIFSCIVEELYDGLDLWEKTCLELEKSPSKDHADILFRIAHNLKGSLKTIGLVQFEKVIHQIEDIINLLKDNLSLVDGTMIAFFLNSQSFFLEWIDHLKKDPHWLPDHDQLDVFFNQALQQFSKLNEHKNNKALPKDIKKELKDDRDTDLKKLAIGKDTLRVATFKIDRLIKLIGELSIQLSIVHHHKDANRLKSPLCLKSIDASVKLIRDLQQQGISFRLQSISNLFQRLERATMDIARDLNKPVRVETYGTECELDMIVAERIIEPLTHIVRNAVDHGIEDSDSRIQKGKDKIAKIIFRASYIGSAINIQICDDGAGINYEKIKKIGLEKGLIGENDNLNNEQLAHLIFLPGFSTADKISNISGRGVGMDVVMAGLNIIGGDITLSSEEGKGTTFKIYVPMSLSLVDTIIVRMNNVKYLIPIQDIHEIVDLNKFKIQIETLGKKYFDFRGEVVPIINLAEVYQATNGNKNQNEKQILSQGSLCLIVEVKSKKIALQVDSIEGQEQIISRDLSSPISESKFYKGSTVLGDGSPGLIVDINSGFSLFEKYF